MCPYFLTDILVVYLLSYYLSLLAFPETDGIYLRATLLIGLVQPLSIFCFTLILSLIIL